MSRTICNIISIVVENMIVTKPLLRRLESRSLSQGLAQEAARPAHQSLLIGPRSRVRRRKAVAIDRELLTGREISVVDRHFAVAAAGRGHGGLKVAGRAVSGLDAVVAGRAARIGCFMTPAAGPGLYTSGSGHHSVSRQSDGREHVAGVGSQRAGGCRFAAHHEETAGADRGLDGVEQGVANGSGYLGGHVRILGSPHRFQRL